MTLAASDDRLLKVAQVALMANVSPRTVWRDIEHGRLIVERRIVGYRARVRVKLSEARRYAMLGDDFSEKTPAGALPK